MSRGATLSTIRARLKAELRDAQETNTVLDAEYNYALDSRQKALAVSYDWPFLQDRWDLSCTAGTRYFTLPTTNVRSVSSTINFERPVLTEVRFNSYYRPVAHGIGATQYNAVFEGVSQDPIQNWSLDTNVGDATNPSQIEVWPTPASTQTMRFTGQRTVGTLSADSDKCDLDDLLLVFYVAADYLAQRQQGNAQSMLAKANEHLIKLRAGYPTKEGRMVLGASALDDRRNVKLIAVT